MEMTGKATPQFVERVWSVSPTTSYRIVVYHQLSGSSPIIWNADDRKSDTSNCRDGMKCFSNSFIYDCCISSIVRTFMDYLKWRWQEKRPPNYFKGRATPQIVATAWSVSVTALYMIVVYHQLSGPSWIIWNGDDRRSDPQIISKAVNGEAAPFSNSFIYDCCISSIVRIFFDFLKCRWQEKGHLNMSKRREVFQWQLYMIVVYHHLSGSSSRVWNRDDRKSDTWNCRDGVKCFSDSFINDCCMLSIVKIFSEYLNWRWQ